MKKKRAYFTLIIVVLLLTVLSSCKDDKDTPAFTSAEGKWTYTTPDAKIKIDFEITKNSSGAFEINGTALTVDGTTVVPVTITDGVNVPTIASMRFSANDAKLVYPYAITFTQATISADFTTIAVTGGEYTFPWGTTKNLSSITIKRP